MSENVITVEDIIRARELLLNVPYRGHATWYLSNYEFGRFFIDMTSGCWERG
jgi:hypothetical protein